MPVSDDDGNKILNSSQSNLGITQHSMNEQNWNNDFYLTFWDGNHLHPLPHFNTAVQLQLDFLLLTNTGDGLPLFAFLHNSRCCSYVTLCYFVTFQYFGVGRSRLTLYGPFQLYRNALECAGVNTNAMMPCVQGCLTYSTVAHESSSNKC